MLQLLVCACVCASVCVCVRHKSGKRAHSQQHRLAHKRSILTRSVELAYVSCRHTQRNTTVVHAESSTLLCRRLTFIFAFFFHSVRAYGIPHTANPNATHRSTLAAPSRPPQAASVCECVACIRRPACIYKRSAFVVFMFVVACAFFSFAADNVYGIGCMR